MYGGFWRRFIALIVDGIVDCIMIAIGVYLFLTFYLHNDAAQIQTIKDAVDNNDYSSKNTLIFCSIAMGTPLLNGVILAASPLQASLGKKMTGLIISTSHNDNIGILRAMFRYIFRGLIIVSGATLAKLKLVLPSIGDLLILSSMFFLVLDIILVIFTPKKRALHDYLAGTVVIINGAVISGKIVVNRNIEDVRQRQLKRKEKKGVVVHSGANSWETSAPSESNKHDDGTKPQW